MVIALLYVYTDRESNCDELTESSIKPVSQESTVANTLQCEAGSHDFDNPLYDEPKHTQVTTDVDKGKYTSSGPGM